MSRDGAADPNRRQFGASIAALAMAWPGAGRAQPAPAEEVSHVPSIPPYAGPWEPLYNHRDLSEWDFWQDGIGAVDRTKTVTVEAGGMIHIYGPQHTGGPWVGLGYIATKREYANYHLRMDVMFGERRYEPQLLAPRNSGVFYHVHGRDHSIWPNGVEYQLAEGGMGDAAFLNSRCWPGTPTNYRAWPVQAGVRPTFPVSPNPPVLERQSVKRVGDLFERIDSWNTVEILCVGASAAHILNGRIVNSFFEMEGRDSVDHRQWRPLTKGRIGIQIEAAETMVKNIRIRPLVV